ncbi:MAG: dihydrofolate reductase [Cellvibrionaceae bacterium]|nr:dihydrofolate reductase [Cellvibrionaceae bacterium]
MPAQITLAMIVAMANNRAIGKDNQLLWHLPEDLKYFKRITMGKPIIMGRKTFDSIGRPLPGRLNIVLSRQKNDLGEAVEVVHTLDEAIQLAKTQAAIDGVDEIMVIGGAQLYAAALDRAEKIYVTQVDADIEGDCFFPALDAASWQQVAHQAMPACEKTAYHYAFCELIRRH